MNNTQITQLVLAIEREYNMGEQDIIFGESKEKKQAYYTFCYLVKELDLPMYDIRVMYEQTEEQIQEGLEEAIQLVDDDPIFIEHLNKIRAQFGLWPIKDRTSKSTHYSLGFVFSELDNIRIQRAKREAAEFMANYGQHWSTKQKQSL
jgi:hypothetical protein